MDTCSSGHCRLSYRFVLLLQMCAEGMSVLVDVTLLSSVAALETQALKLSSQQATEWMYVGEPGRTSGEDIASSDLVNSAHSAITQVRGVSYRPVLVHSITAPISNYLFP